MRYLYRCSMTIGRASYDHHKCSGPVVGEAVAGGEPGNGPRFLPNQKTQDQDEECQHNNDTPPQDAVRRPA
jgi:hypothetical protein